MAEDTWLGRNTTISADLHGILRATGVGIWSYDGTTGQFTLDDTCRELFDFPADEPLDRDRMRQCIHPDDRAAYAAAVQGAMTGDREFSIEYRILRRDGTVRFISGRGRIPPNLPGEPMSVTGVCIDVSERRNLQDRLHATELQIRTFADGFPGLFCYVDQDYVVRHLSHRYVEHIGLPHDQLVGRHLRDLTGHARFLERKAVYAAALAGHSYSFEDMRLLPDGQERHYTITYHPHRDAFGAVRGFMTIGLDITELHNAERALQERTRELSRSNHDLEQFAYVASHDLKAPLRAIDVLVGWLREDLAGLDQGKVQENLGLLAQRTARLHRLLDDLLAYSRAGRGNAAATMVDTARMVQDIAVLLAPPPTMRIEADASLPVIGTPATPLEQVLRNLVNNAIKHHPTGSGLVRVSAWQRDGEVEFAVEDDGAGIPPEFAGQVFQMFQKFSQRDEVEGSGMGLAIVRRIVEGQGGRVWFHPGRGECGTVFRFTWKPVPVTATGTGNRDAVTAPDRGRSRPRPHRGRAPAVQ